MDAQELSSHMPVWPLLIYGSATSEALRDSTFPPVGGVLFCVVTTWRIESWRTASRLVERQTEYGLAAKSLASRSPSLLEKHIVSIRE
jgi:hypothetical protein